jgi:hypothetical protein
VEKNVMQTSYRNIMNFLVIAVAALAAATAAQAGDFQWGDDFETGPTCAGVSPPAVVALTSPGDRATTLGTGGNHLIKVRSCGYAGGIILGVSGNPASWTVAVDPTSMTLASGGYGVAELAVTIPTDGDSGAQLLDVAVHSTANTAHASVTYDVANQVIINIDEGTGSGSHTHFPPFLKIKSGTMLRFTDDDSVALHAIHSDGGIGFPHQSPPGMTKGQEYDVTPTDTSNPYFFYCHNHPGTESTHLTVE